MWKQGIFLALLALVAMTTRVHAQEPESGSEISEEQVKEVIIKTTQAVAQDIATAVQTINEIFGNPACTEDGAAEERDAGVVKRKINWGHAAAGAALAFLGKRSAEEDALGRRSEREEQQVTKRSWHDFFSGAAAAALIGKRSEGEKEQVTKRSWHDFFSGAAAAALIGKRSEGEQKRKINWGHAALGAAAALIGKRADADKRSELLQKRKIHWGHAAAGAAAYFLGKREDQQEVAQPTKRVFYFVKRSDGEVVDSGAEETEFRADIVKLSSALDVLNNVLVIAKAVSDPEQQS